MKLKTDHVEYIGDADEFAVFAAIPNGQFTAEGKNQFELRLNGENASTKALVHGGVAVWSNLKPEAIRTALVVGIEFLSRTGQLSAEMFQEGGLDG
jgi:hypothetical protein